MYVYIYIYMYIGHDIYHFLQIMRYKTYIVGTKFRKMHHSISENPAGATATAAPWHPLACPGRRTSQYSEYNDII